MLWVVDKKVIRHTIDAGTALVEVPIRIRFEYCLRDERFVEGTLKRDVLYNRPELLRRFPQLQESALDAEIEGVVDRTIVEHLMFAGYAAGDVRLFASDADDEVGGKGSRHAEDTPVPEIIMPRRSMPRGRRED